MIVHPPEVTSEASELVVTARIESDGDLPPSLWFAFPRSCGEYLIERMDGFAAALLPLAMHRGEPLHVEGAVSQHLAYGLREYQRVQSLWKPGLFQQVDVRYRELVDGRRLETAGAVGLAFSGGVDSFHALWSHLPENEPLQACRVTHCLMINGFDEDAELDGNGSFDSIRGIYEPLMAKLGIELIVVRTNLLAILGQMVRSQSYASFLAAPALLLGPLLSHFYIAAGWTVTMQGLYPDGSHLMLDHLVSTESLRTATVDTHLSRVEKLAALAGWPETYDRLRVCWRPTGVQADRPAIANCCACQKCLRTMITLEVIGALDRFSCFPQPLVRQRIRDLDFAWEPGVLLIQDVIELARREGRPDIARDIRRAIWRSRRLRPALRRIFLASGRLEERSRLYRALLVPPKLLARRLGLSAAGLT